MPTAAPPRSTSGWKSITGRSRRKMPSDKEVVTTKAPRHQGNLGVLVPWWFKSLSKYYAIFRIELRQLTAYTWDFILSNITIVLFFYVLLQVWQITASPEHVEGMKG